MFVVVMICASFMAGVVVCWCMRPRYRIDVDFPSGSSMLEAYMYRDDTHSGEKTKEGDYYMFTKEGKFIEYRLYSNGNIVKVRRKQREPNQ